MSLTTEQQVLIEKRIANEKKSPFVAYVLWFFFGIYVAAHRYYLGRWRTALIHDVMMAIVLLAILGNAVSPDFKIAIQPFFFFFFGMTVVVGLWWLADALLLPGMLGRAQDKLRRRLTADLTKADG